MIFSYSIIQLKKLDPEYMTVDKNQDKITLQYDPDNDNTADLSVNDYVSDFIFTHLLPGIKHNWKSLSFVSIMVGFASLLFIPSKVKEQLREKNLSFRVVGLLNLTLIIPFIYLSYTGSK